MAAFIAGVAEVPVVPNATGFSALLTRQLAPATAKLETGFKGVVQRLTGSVTGLGTSIGTSLGLGLGIAAVAAGKMALDFENAFTKIAALSNSSAADIERWKDQVLSLSGETARAPQELADALFFLSSAGLESGQVMGALSVSAKAAAVGLGSTVDVANIVASALNAYAGSALTAAQVTDTLVAAVRAGRAEPEEFANSLGRLLPIAVQAGVSFQDLTASLASLSNVGLDVDEAATAMRGALQAIAAPGSQAADAMDQLGLSAQDLLDAISAHGLFGAFQLLDQAARDSTSTQADYIGVLRKVIPNVRALTGILGLTGQEAAKVNSVFEQTTNSTGDLNTAFQTWLQGPGASFAKLFTGLKVAAIQFGEAILPIARTIAQVLTPVLSLAADNANLLLVAFIGYKTLAFLPTLLLGVATALTDIGFASSAATAGVLSTSAGIAGIAGPVGLATVGIVGLGLALAHLTGHDDPVMTVLGDSLAELATQIPSVKTGLEGLTGPLTGTATGSTSTAGAVTQLANAHQEAATAARAQSSAELALAGGLAGVLSSLQSTGEAEKTLAQAQALVNRLRGQSATGTAKYRDAINALHQAQVAALQSELGLASGVQALRDQVASGDITMRGAIAQIKTFGQQAGLAKGDIQGMVTQLREAIRNYTELAKAPDLKPKVDVSVTDHTQTTLDRIQARVLAITRRQRLVDIGVTDNTVKPLATIEDKIGALTKAPFIATLKADVSAATTSFQNFYNAWNGKLVTFLVNAITPPVHPAATGFHGMVSRPTLFLAGESGSERVDVTPGGRGPGGGNGQITGQLQMVDWHRGLVDLQAELDHQDFVGAH